MDGDKQYKDIFSITSLMYEWGKKIVLPGEQIPINVNTVIASINREVNLS